ncbi:MAG: PD-(D/E)XK nuclease family protein [Chloroflexi bacterium]|nr:PD-(D/E)XK nuclease family protein [Chloroflexota bacterium]
MPRRQIFCAAYQCGKTRQLANVAREALAAGAPLGQILALTVHRPAAAVLREMLRDVTEQSVPTTTVRQRATAILQAFPEVADLPAGWNEAALLSGIDRRRLIRQAWATAGAGGQPLYAQHGQQPGALDWIALLFDRFGDWAGTADPALLPAPVIADPSLDELWQAYRVYLRLCRQHRVVAFNEVFTRAIDALRLPEVRQANLRQVLLLDDLDLFQPAELLFATALIDSATDVFASTVSEPRADSSLARERWIARWTRLHELQPVTGAAPTTAPQLTVGEYTTADTEAHAIARSVVEHLSSGATPNELAIIAFDPELVPLLQRALLQYGVVTQGQSARDGYMLALAPLALAGLKLLADRTLTLAETSALLRHQALGLSSADAHAVIEAAEQQRFQPFDPGDNRWPRISPAGCERLSAVRAVTQAIRATDKLPSAQLQSWLAALDLEQRAWQQTEAALDDWAITIDRRHWTRLLDFLRQSERLGAALGDPLTLDAAVDVFTSAQALIIPEGQSHERAVAIWQPATLGGCSAQTVFVAGLHEGALPQPLHPLPFANDEALIAAFGALPGFIPPQIHDRAAAWERARQELQRAIGRAGSAVQLSYSRADRQGRTRLPSPVLANAIGAQIDRHGQLHSPMIERTLAADQSAEELGLWPQRFNADALLELQPPLPSIVPPSDSPFRVSPTAIEDYFTCPRRCFYARSLNLYDVVSSPRQALGHVVHNALNDLLYEGGDEIDESQARALVARHWLPNDHRWGSQLKETVFRQLAEKAVMQLARYEHERPDRTTFLGGELGFEWLIPGTDIVVNGRIDRIDRGADGLHVIDYKLGQQSPSINELLNEFVPPRDEKSDAAWRPGDIQLPVYALALEQGKVEGMDRRPDERVVSVALIYPLELFGENGKPSVKGHRELRLIDHAPESCAACATTSERSPKTGTLCRAQLDTVADRVLETVARMRAAEWPADPREGSQTCAGCAFRPVCSNPQ